MTINTRNTSGKLKFFEYIRNILNTEKTHRHFNIRLIVLIAASISSIAYFVSYIRTFSFISSLLSFIRSFSTFFYLIN